MRPAPVTPFAFLAPSMLILGVFVLWAAVQVFALSFMRVDLFADGGLWGDATFVGLANFERVWSSPRFWWCLGNSFLYLLVTPVLMAVSLGAALVVTSGLRGLGPGLRALLFLPVVTPTIVAAIAWRVLFNEDAGVLNAALPGAVPWLSEYPWVLVTAATVTLWKGFGYYMMIFAAALLAVPRELEEAASIDGAGRASVFWNVTLPSIKPVVVLVALISSISALKVFDELYVTVRGAPVASKTAVPLIYET
ncbi:MAG: sugar ABC transporter permease, partial [Planctomycetota bacterium]